VGLADRKRAFSPSTLNSLDLQKSMTGRSQSSTNWAAWGTSLAISRGMEMTPSDDFEIGAINFFLKLLIDKFNVKVYFLFKIFVISVI